MRRCEMARGHAAGRTLRDARREWTIARPVLGRRWRRRKVNGSDRRSAGSIDRTGAGLDMKGGGEGDVENGVSKWTLVVH